MLSATVTDKLNKMSKKAKEILELHMGADYWRLEQTDYFDNLINAVDEALSITDVVKSVCNHNWIGATQIHSKCTKCGAMVRDDD